MARTLFVGDVHGCARALDALVTRAKPDRLILLGDLFTKGPDPQGVWARVADWRPECVMGNHDARMLRMWGLAMESKAAATAARLPEAARVWLEARPSTISGEHDGRPWIAVHGGLHPTAGIFGTDPVMGYLLRRWPDDTSLAQSFWWQLYRRRERVFYGHDAMRGLQVRPHTVGLDTGCCYGHALSGYLLEEEQVVQVRPDGAPIDPPQRFWTDYSEPG